MNAQKVDLKESFVVKIRRYFVAGLVMVLPLILSVFIFWTLFSWVENTVNTFLKRFSVIQIPGLGVLFLLLIITFIGMLATNLIGRRLFAFFEKILIRIPLFNKVYRAIQEISYASLGRGKGLFRETVLIEYPRQGLFALAFVTDRTREEISKKLDRACLNVFIPTSPNPTSGMLIIVPEEKVIRLSMTVEEAFKLIVSGGAFTPLEIQKRKVK